MDCADSSILPERGHPDRKRTLNVLAQRRYRARMRRKIAALEGKDSNTAKQCSVNSEGRLQSSTQPTDSPQSQASVPSCPISDFCVEFSTDDFLNLQSEDTLESLGTAAAKGVADVPSRFDNGSLSNEVLDFTTISKTFKCPTLAPDQRPLEPSSMIDSCLGNELQSLELSQFTFPDDSVLEVPALQLLRVGMHHAETLGCANSIWDPSARRVLSLSDIRVSNLPCNMWPTEVQMIIQHHPIFDILPWPSVREKLIRIFEQPLALRPPAARDTNAVVNIFYDMDDPTDGCRFDGGADYEADNWEVGQAFFQNWWWALDRPIVDRSNALRSARGVKPLYIKST